MNLLSTAVPKGDMTMKDESYQYVNVESQDGAMWVTIQHSPLPVLDNELMTELNDWAGKVAKDENV